MNTVIRADFQNPSTAVLKISPMDVGEGVRAQTLSQTDVTPGPSSKPSKN